MTDAPDGYVEVTITGRYPVYLASYGEEGDDTITIDDAAAIDEEQLENEVVTVYDLIDWLDAPVVTMKAAEDE